MSMRNGWIHYRADEGGSGGGDGGGSGSETQEEVAAREAREADERRRSGSGGNEDMVPKREVQEANREAQKLRERLRDAEKERDDLKKSQMTDAEKVQKERDDAVAAKAAADKRVRDLQVQVLAGKIGIVDPEAASALLDWSSISDPDDSKAVEKALKDLVKDKPYLAGKTAGGGDGGAGNGSGAGRSGNMNDLIRAGAGRG